LVLDLQGNLAHSVLSNNSPRQSDRKKMNMLSRFRAALTFTLTGIVFLGISASSAKADQVFTVNTNISGTGNVGATANFHQSAPNLLQITVSNTGATANVGQAISGIQFQIFSGGALLNITGSISSQNNPLIQVGGGGAVTNLGTLATGWGLQSAGPSFNLTGLGFKGNGPNPPDELILGTLDDPNGSIAANAPHNPFIDHSGVFTLTLSQNLPSNFLITNVVFLFGTEPSSVNGTPGTPVPEPATMVLLGTGLLGFASFLRRSRRS
jgi:PEP-CTERM motif